MESDNSKLIILPNPGPPVFGVLIAATGIYGITSTTMSAWAGICVILIGLILVLNLRIIEVRQDAVFIRQVVLRTSRTIPANDIVQIHISKYRSAFGPVNATILLRLNNRRNILLSTRGMRRKNADHLIRFFHTHYADKIS